MLTHVASHICTFSIVVRICCVEAAHVEGFMARLQDWSAALPALGTSYKYVALMPDYTMHLKCSNSIG